MSTSAESDVVEASGPVRKRPEPAAGEDVQAPAGPRDWAVRLVWLWPALVTLGLGVRGSARPELWRDELATWSAATRSTGQLWAMLHHVDAVSGTYYLFMHGWISVFGDSPTMFRLPSALAMAGAAACVVLAARKLFDTRTALAAGLLFAIFPSISRYAQEGRAYAFAVLAVAAATWLLLRAVERPGSVLRWLPYTVSVMAAGLFHMVTLTVLASHALIVLLRWRRERRRALLIGFPVAVLVALLPMVPLVIVGRRQVGRQISWLHSPTLQDFVTTWHGMFGSALVSLCVLVLCALPVAWPRSRRRAVEIGLVAALPVLAVWVVSQGSTSYFLDRYLLFTVPAWAVLAGAGLTSLRPRPLIAVGLIGTALLGLQDQQALRTRTSHEWADERGAARIIAKGYHTGDGIVPVRGDQAYMMLDFAMAYYLPRDVHPKDVFAEKTPVQNNDLYSVTCPDADSCAGGTDRLWVVTYGDQSDPLKGLPADEVKVLTSEFDQEQVKHVQGITVSLLERTKAAG
ncbi:glycosyltransferase family 39 protein [Kitasatospora sp. NPDC052896]|uniref:glycosyltransferase family 39 protein n=1 Tax=Kitasatospora sp. NPDC052896 TaxID=3364061 RepID=UPI0037CAC55F